MWIVGCGLNPGFSAGAMFDIGREVAWSSVWRHREEQNSLTVRWVVRCDLKKRKQQPEPVKKGVQSSHLSSGS
jgi:hypothetical protein